MDRKTVDIKHFCANPITLLTCRNFMLRMEERPIWAAPSMCLYTPTLRYVSKDSILHIYIYLPL
jgi:hypothetical protein